MLFAIELPTSRNFVQYFLDRIIKINLIQNITYLVEFLEIFWFFETCKLGVSDVIYSRLINYIHKMVSISVNNRQNSFKLYMRIAIW